MTNKLVSKDNCWSIMALRNTYQPMVEGSNIRTHCPHDVTAIPCTTYAILTLKQDTVSLKCILPRLAPSLLLS